MTAEDINRIKYLRIEIKKKYFKSSISVNPMNQPADSHNERACLSQKWSMSFISEKV